MVRRSVATQKIAGRLLAMAPGMRLAPLFARTYYNLVQDEGKPGKPDIEEFITAMSWLEENIERFRSRSFDSPETAITLMGDASEIGGGAHELVPPGKEPKLDGPIVISFDEEQMKRMKSDKTFHSELREAWCMSQTVEIVCKKIPAKLLDGKSITYITDAQSLFHDANSMSPHGREVLEHVRKAHLAAATVNCTLNIQWRPRDQNEEADFLSKVTDTGDLHIPLSEAERVWSELNLRPTFDCFAAAHNKKCESYAARYLDSSSAIVDALAHGKYIAEQHKCCWIFPPLHMTEHAMEWITRNKISGIFIYPAAFKASWWPKLRTLPVSDTAVISAERVTRGPRLPKGYSLPNVKELYASAIQW